jgi:hypothetical protein
MPADPSVQRGLTVAEVARRYRVSPDRVRAWIAAGQLRAINRTDSCLGRPRWVIPPEALAAFEAARAAAPPPRPARRRRQLMQVDYYPGD